MSLSATDAEHLYKAVHKAVPKGSRPVSDESPKAKAMAPSGRRIDFASSEGKEQDAEPAGAQERKIRNGVGSRKPLTLSEETQGDSRRHFQTAKGRSGAGSQMPSGWRYHSTGEQRGPLSRHQSVAVISLESFRRDPTRAGIRTRNRPHMQLAPSAPGAPATPHSYTDGWRQTFRSSDYSHLHTLTDPITGRYGVPSSPRGIRVTSPAISDEYIRMTNKRLLLPSQRGTPRSRSPHLRETLHDEPPQHRTSIRTFSPTASGPGDKMAATLVTNVVPSMSDTPRSSILPFDEDNNFARATYGIYMNISTHQYGQIFRSRGLSSDPSWYMHDRDGVDFRRKVPP
ncbi:unnamed protein product [Vitrella brassicaformis CCMP3155]|uniref:Uncharacterized protein n=2 Tax=Vitrella brassicaformis TaxID=1169539 RepID=A0A0G4G7V5_VITBC|nr:unnamed protein product [Vitrella brassicaformis CCMP3155]|eukprot:CEM24492.1 unnamed protein product [Vitrella brassicaformis CCMP3155]